MNVPEQKMTHELSTWSSEHNVHEIEVVHGQKGTQHVKIIFNLASFVFKLPMDHTLNYSIIVLSPRTRMY